MTNKNTTTTPIEERAAAAPLSSGNQLQHLRTTAGISREQLAEKLCISAKKLQLLENDQYERMPNTTYVRGYLRNACKVLKADPEPLLEAFECEFPKTIRGTLSISKGASQQALILQTRPNRLIFFSASALLFFILAAGAWWSFNGNPTLKAEMSETIHNEPESLAPINVNPQVGLPNNSEVQHTTAPTQERLTEDHTSEQQTANTVIALASTEILPGTTTIAPRGRDTSTIALQFSQEAWIEVVDSQGEILLSKIQPAGSSIELSGAPPFQLMLGNAAATTVNYLGEEVESAPIDNQRTRTLLVGGG